MKTKDEVVRIRITKEAKCLLQSICKEKDITMSGAIRIMIAFWINKNKPI